MGQFGFDDAVWLVVDKDGQPVAAASYTDDDVRKWRIVHDLYGAEGHALAALALGEVLERFCDDQGYELRGTTDPENGHYLRVLMRRGYELTAVEYRRVPRARIGSEDLAPDSQERRDFLLSEVP